MGRKVRIRESRDKKFIRTLTPTMFSPTDIFLIGTNDPAFLPYEEEDGHYHDLGIAYDDEKINSLLEAINGFREQIAAECGIDAEEIKLRTTTELGLEAICALSGIRPKDVLGADKGARFTVRDILESMDVAYTEEDFEIVDWLLEQDPERRDDRRRDVVIPSHLYRGAPNQNDMLFETFFDLTSHHEHRLTREDPERMVKTDFRHILTKKKVTSHEEGVFPITAVYLIRPGDCQGRYAVEAIEHLNLSIPTEPLEADDRRKYMHPSEIKELMNGGSFRSNYGIVTARREIKKDMEALDIPRNQVLAYHSKEGNGPGTLFVAVNVMDHSQLHNALWLMENKRPVYDASTIDHVAFEVRREEAARR